MVLTIPERSRRVLQPVVSPLADAAAFAETVQARLPAMVRLAARIAPQASPDDIVQEALIRAWRYRGKFDPRKGTVWGWLMAIVVNEARRATSRQYLPIAIRPAGEPSSVDDREDVDAAVRRLAPRQRLAVDCFYYADLSISETASIMGCTEGTVKSTLADARERLRSMLEERG